MCHPEPDQPPKNSTHTPVPGTGVRSVTRFQADGSTAKTPSLLIRLRGNKKQQKITRGGGMTSWEKNFNDSFMQNHIIELLLGEYVSRYVNDQQNHIKFLSSEHVCFLVHHVVSPQKVRSSPSSPPRTVVDGPSAAAC